MCLIQDGRHTCWGRTARFGLWLVQGMVTVHDALESVKYHWKTLFDWDSFTITRVIPNVVNLEEGFPHLSELTIDQLKWATRLHESGNNSAPTLSEDTWSTSTSTKADRSCKWFMRLEKLHIPRPVLLLLGASPMSPHSSAQKERHFICLLPK